MTLVPVCPEEYSHISAAWPATGGRDSRRCDRRGSGGLYAQPSAAPAGETPEGFSVDRPHVLGTALPPQRIGQTAAMVAWLPEQVIQRTRALRVQGQAVFADDAHASMDLMPTVAYLEIGFAGHGFRKVHAGSRWPTCVQLPQRLIRGPTRGVQMVDDVDDVVLHPLEPANRLAKLYTRAAIGHGHIKYSLARAHLVGTQNGNGLQRRGFERLPTLPLGSTQNSRGRHPHVGKTDLVHLPHPPGQGANRHPRSSSVDDQEGNTAAGTIAGRGRTHGTDQVRGSLGVMHEQLDAVERIGAALQAGTHLHGLRTPAVMGFGDSEAQHPLTRGHLG